MEYNYRSNSVSIFSLFDELEKIASKARIFNRVRQMVAEGRGLTNSSSAFHRSRGPGGMEGIVRSGVVRPSTQSGPAHTNFGEQAYFSTGRLTGALTPAETFVRTPTKNLSARPDFNINTPGHGKAGDPIGLGANVGVTHGHQLGRDDTVFYPNIKGLGSSSQSLRSSLKELNQTKARQAPSAFYSVAKANGSKRDAIRESRRALTPFEVSKVT